MAIANKFPTIRPSLNLDFANSKTVDPRVTFTRNSAATYFDEQGVMRTAPAGVPRLDHDPVTGECKGLLIEEQRTNLLTHSEQFDNAPWSTVRATITSNANTAPDGTLTADKLVEDTTASNTHRISYPTVSFTSGTVYTYSIYVKAADRSEIQMGFHFQTTGSAFGSASAYFNLATGTVAAASGLVAAIEPAGNGHYRCSITAAAVASVACSPSVFLGSSGVATYTGDGTSGIYLWGAQVEEGSTPSSYIKTEASQVTRAADTAVMTGTNFSDWWNPTEGTLVWSGSLNVPSKFDGPSIAAFSDGTGNNRHQLYGSLGDLLVRTAASGVTSNNVFSGYTLSSGATKTAAFAVAAGKVYTSQMGGAVTETTQALPVVGRLYIGGGATGVVSGIQRIKRLAYYPKALPTNLQALTAQ